MKIICAVLKLIDMIHENSPVTNSFVSVPADMGHLNCAAFIAGIIAGMLDSARFVSLISICHHLSLFWRYIITV